MESQLLQQLENTISGKNSTIMELDAPWYDTSQTSNKG